MDKPARGNALCPAMMSELARVFRESTGSAVRVALIQGRGDRAFCTGYDLAELSAMKREDAAPDDWASSFPELTEMLRTNKLDLEPLHNGACVLACGPSGPTLATPHPPPVPCSGPTAQNWP